MQRALVKKRRAEKPTAIVGFCEDIFSDKAGALGSFAAAAEFAFGTIVQRTMDTPGNVRMHYGHPDLMNKLHIITRGGPSKATRQLHISEDIFGGFNHTLRGGRIKYREYMRVGKGRDMGLDSINAFEIKISGGAGEVMISRDLWRLASRLDPYDAWIDDLVSSKFSYVVSSQIRVDVLLEVYDKLKVAFLDFAPFTLDGPNGTVTPAGTACGGALAQYSVLIQGRRGPPAAWESAEFVCAQRVEELYRVRLPHNRYSQRGVVIGEGKPENQNHAIIFCLGEGLQTIDMNQDNCLAEAFKMRNMLGELEPEVNNARAVTAPLALLPNASGRDMQRALVKKRRAEKPTAIVGFCEDIFSDKGGPSKATRQLHISEDIFGGFNHTLRGGRIKYR
ncbi:FKS1_dom1 domain-containing protein, partial [Haematococcus lacustris]